MIFNVIMQSYLHESKSRIIVLNNTNSYYSKIVYIRFNSLNSKIAESCFIGRWICWYKSAESNRLWFGVKETFLFINLVEILLILKSFKLTIRLSLISSDARLCAKIRVYKSCVKIVHRVRISCDDAPEITNSFPL